MKQTLITMLLFGLLLLSACSAQNAVIDDAQSTSAAWATEIAVPTNSPAAEVPVEPAPLQETAAVQPTPELPSGAVMVFQRTGGVAGINEQFTLYADGRVVAADGSETQIDANNVSLLLTTVRSAGFFEMEAQYGQPQCCDRFAYMITVRDGDQVHTVTAFDGVEETPPALVALLSQLEMLLPR